jgi:hypothetical protein
MQVGNSSLSTYLTEMHLSANAYYNSGWKYVGTGFGARYSMNDVAGGTHAWFTAPSGTAGNAITFTQAMTLDASGNLGIGTTTPDIFGRGDARNVGISVVGASDNMALQLNAGGSAGRGAQIYMGQGGTRHFTISSNATETRVGTTTSTPLILTTNDNTRLTIASTGAATFSSSVTAVSALLQSAHTDAVVDIFSLYNPSQTSSGVRQKFANGYGDLAAIKVSQIDNGAGADNGKIEFQTATDSVLSTKLTILDTGAATFSGDLTINGTNKNVQLGSSTLPTTSNNLRHYFAGSATFAGQDGVGEANVGNNFYFNGGFLRRDTDAVSNIRFNAGLIYLQVAASGAANSAITWTNALTIANSGAATFSSGIGIGGATATTGGIQFPATAVAIADANNLDDYEEGTWTPTLTTSGGTPPTVVSSSGRYIIIGKLVTIYFKFLLSSASGGSGQLKITNAPFSLNLSTIPAVGFARITDLGLTLNCGFLTGTVINFNKYDGNYAGTDYETVGQVSYYND